MKAIAKAANIAC